jgi:hypothetical protein
MIVDEPMQHESWSIQLSAEEACQIVRLMALSVCMTDPSSLQGCRFGWLLYIYLRSVTAMMLVNA